MEEFKKGQRIVVIEADDFDRKNYGYDIGYTGTINENTDENPFILFDNEKANYTEKGTALANFQFKITDEH